jgi:toxin ParE1/3/4
MRPKRLDWSLRASTDLDNIIAFYAEAASPALAAAARQAILDAAVRIATLPAIHRPGQRGSRECVLRRFPYIVIYRATAGTVHIVRVLHQAREYFNR